MSAVDLIRVEQYSREKYDEEVLWKPMLVLIGLELCPEERNSPFEAFK